MILNKKRMSFSEVAEWADVHKTTVWRWTKLGVRGRRLATRMIGGRRYVLVSDLEDFLEEPADESDERAHDAADAASKLLDAHGVRRR